MGPLRWMILYAPILCAQPAATPASAPATPATPIPLEALTTAYWSHQYDIPDFYATVSAGIVSSDTSSATTRFERVMDKLGARKIPIDRRLLNEPLTGSAWPADGQTVWELQASRAKALSSSLRKLPGCNYIRERAIPSPREELQFKHDGLINEAASHYEITASTVVRSFLETEFQTLDQLLERDRLASQTIGLFVTVAPPGKSPPYVDAPTLHVTPPQAIFVANDPALARIHLSSGPSAFPYAYWNRASPEGEARPEATMVVDMTGDPDYHTQRFGEQIPKKAARLSATPYTSSSKFLQFPGWQKFDIQWPPLYFTLPKNRLDLFRDKMAPGSKLIYWSMSEENAAAFAMAAKKRDLLSAERSRLDLVLESAPLTRTLLDAEVSRLSPFAQKSVEQAGTAVVRVVLAVRR